MLQRVLQWRSALPWSSSKPIDRAVYSAHRLWAKRYPEWEAAFFDEHFLRTRVLQLLGEKPTITPMELAQAWIAQFYGVVRREQQLLTELTPVAADFLYFVASELRYFEAEAQRPTARQRLWAWWQGRAQRRTATAPLPGLRTDSSCQDASG